MKLVLFLVLALKIIGCSTMKKANQNSVLSQSEKGLIKNISDFTIRLPGSPL